MSCIGSHEHAVLCDLSSFLHEFTYILFGVRARVCVRGREQLCVFYVRVHLGFFHTHLAFVSVTMETSCDLPHPLTRTDPLHKVGREQSHHVPAFPLVHKHGHTHTQAHKQCINH